MLTLDDLPALRREVRVLAAERDAVILAHNYQLPEIQDVADFVGDSLGLSRQAAAAGAEVIAFCGVHFMAETASILSPDKTVLLPDLDAGCSLADSITADQLRAWKAEHPGAVVVMYVNTTAEVKAETDYCCTSSNAVQVVQHIWREHGDDTEILFGPDMWLGAYVERETGRRLQVWDGECHVHAGIRPGDITDVREEHPDAEFLIHPECGCTTQVMEYVAAGDVDPERTHMLSTGGMLSFAAGSDASEFIVATETGMLHPLEQENPGKSFIAANPRGRLPLHEDDHAAEAARRTARPLAAGAGRPRSRRTRSRSDRADGRDLAVAAQRMSATDLMRSPAGVLTSLTSCTRAPRCRALSGQARPLSPPPSPARSSPRSGPKGSSPSPGSGSSSSEPGSPSSFSSPGSSGSSSSFSSPGSSSSVLCDAGACAGPAAVPALRLCLGAAIDLGLVHDGAADRGPVGEVDREHAAAV